MKCQSEIIMDPLILCPVGTDAQEGDAGLCVLHSSMSMASPPETSVLHRGTQVCPDRTVACREGLTEDHYLQGPPHKLYPPAPSGLEARERVLRYLNIGLVKNYIIP